MWKIWRNKINRESSTSPNVKLFNKSILVVSDVHRNTVDLPDGEQNLVLLLGDIPFFIVQEIDKRFKCPKLGVLGNHDGPDYLEETGVVNIHRSVVTVEGITFAGFGGAPRYNGRAHGQYTEQEAKEFIESINHVDVLISHSNPRLTSDPLEDPIDAGFQAFTDYIGRYHPAHYFHGHIHEQLEYDIGSTKVHSIYQAQQFDI